MSMSLRIEAIIPARGGSQRLPRKNIYPINGHPMIHYAIAACYCASHDINAWVCSEDAEILTVAKQLNAGIIKRPVRLAADSIYKQEVIRYAANAIESHVDYTPDICISLQANSPEIQAHELDNAIRLLIEEELDEVMAAYMTDSCAVQNPTFRVMKWHYAFQRDLSTNCGFVNCAAIDVHTKEDAERAEIYIKERGDDGDRGRPVQPALGQSGRAEADGRSRPAGWS